MLDTLGESVFSNKLDELQNDIHTVCLINFIYLFKIIAIINDFMNEHVFIYTKYLMQFANTKLYNGIWKRTRHSAFDLHMFELIIK